MFGTTPKELKHINTNDIFHYTFALTKRYLKINTHNYSDTIKLINDFIITSTSASKVTSGL
jgi:hypothetical protein